MREEVRRLADLHAAGHAAGIAKSIVERLARLREQIGPLVRGLRNFLMLVPRAPTDSTILSMVLGFVAISPKGREAASRWVADPARHMNEAGGKIAVILEVVETYRAALAKVRPPPAPKPQLEEAVFKAEPPPPPPQLESVTFEPAPAPPKRPSVAEDPDSASFLRAAGERPRAVEPSPEPDADPSSFMRAAEGFVGKVPPPPPPAAEKPAPPPPVPAGVPARVGDPFQAAPKMPAELPPGVDPDILDDVRRVQQCRKVFEVTHQQIEVWEVFCLVMLDASTKPLLDKLLVLRDSDEGAFTDGALTLFEKLLDMRSKHGKFVRHLREYIADLPVGHFGRDTMEMALGFIVASARGRQAAERWIADPAHYKTEAAGRLEDLISKTMNYETALRMIGP
jgi:hypothetical protein